MRPNTLSLLLMAVLLSVGTAFAGQDLDGGTPHITHVTGLGHGMAGLHHPFDGAFLGVQLTDLTPELRQHFGVPEDVGVMVSRVVGDSPAFRAGVQVGDVITGVSSAEITSSRSLSAEISRREGGDTVNLEIWRKGGVEQISATLEERSGSGMTSHHVQLGDCEGDDCGTHLVDFTHCAGEEPCRVEVRCEDGDCSCTVDGEPAECEGLHEGHTGD